MMDREDVPAPSSPHPAEPEVPDVPSGRTSWHPVDLFAILFFIYGFYPALAVPLLQQAGLYRGVYGEELAALVFEDGQSRDRQKEVVGLWAGGLGAEVLLPLQRRLAEIRFGLWASVAMFPLQLATILLVLARHESFRMGQLGLTWRGARRALALGLAGWVVLTPLILGLNFLAASLMQRGLGAEPDQHPLALVGQAGLLPVEWALLILTAVLVAPVLEEVVFRGLLQRWLGSHPEACGVIVAAAAGVAFLYSRQDMAQAGLSRPGELAVATLPLLFVLACVPLVLLVRRRPRALAVAVVSLLFAAIHSFAWPSPVALLVLGLGLGLLLEWTDSLLGPILLHSLFNGVSCALLFLV